MIKNIYQKILPESVRRKIAYLRSDGLNHKGLPADLLYFKRKRIIFIHIPKAAGLSLYNALFNKDSFGHKTIRRYEDLMTPNEFDKCYKFTFVRNPYDRIHSAFYYLKAEGRGRPIDIDYSNELRNVATFEEFILDWLNVDNLYKMEHFSPQTFYLKDIKNEINFDFIGKFENIENDFRVVAKVLKVDEELSFLNKGKSIRSSFEDEYSKQMINVVNELYHEDFEFLGYRKMDS